MSPNGVFSSLTLHDGDVCRGQERFTRYYGAFSTWYGGLTTLDAGRVQGIRLLPFGLTGSFKKWY